MLFGSGSEIGACLDDADHVGSPALGFEKHLVQKKRVFIFLMDYSFFYVEEHVIHIFKTSVLFNMPSISSPLSLKMGCPNHPTAVPSPFVY